MTASPFPPIRGVIFDLDGTVVDSALDFEAMRCEMELPAGTPLLEAMAAMHDDAARRCQSILDRHEQAGAERAVLIPGVAEFLRMLDERSVRTAVWTRNGRAATDATLARLGLSFERVVTREDAPVKPDPTAIWAICEAWRVEPREMLLIGDFVFDLEAARRAGIRGVLFTGGAEPHACRGHELADFFLRTFRDTAELTAWMGFGGC